jgi:UDP-2,3-diacylglucosamine hydrolase
MADIYLIGDSHIGLTDGDEASMVAWLDRLEKRRPAALYLNGDLFHYYIGDAKFATPSVQKLFERVRRLRDSGVPVHYVEGNRDFFLENSLAADSVSAITLQSRFKAGGRTFLVVHGDMINDGDLPYRTWRFASKNPVTRLAVKMLPKKVAKRLIDAAEEKLARTNFKHKTRLPTELMQQYGERQLSRGIDHVVFGHFHHKLTLAAGRATVTVLPAWFEKGEAMVVDSETGEVRFEVV